MAERDSFVLYTKIDEVIAELNDTQVAQLFRAIVSYEKTGEYQIDDPIARVAFIPVRQELDMNNEKWDKTREARSEAGKQGGRPPKANAFSEKQTKAKKANANFAFSEKAKKAVYENVNVNENVNENVNVNVPPTEAKREGKRAGAFHPPTVFEVQDYCRERGNSVDAERFVDFYASKGWYVGKNKMKDWRAAVRNWERERAPTARSGTTQIDEWAAALREVDS